MPVPKTGGDRLALAGRESNRIAIITLRLLTVVLGVGALLLFVVDEEGQRRKIRKDNAGDVWITDQPPIQSRRVALWMGTASAVIFLLSLGVKYLSKYRLFNQITGGGAAFDALRG